MVSPMDAIITLNCPVNNAGGAWVLGGFLSIAKRQFTMVLNFGENAHVMCACYCYS